MAPGPALAGLLRTRPPRARTHAAAHVRQDGERVKGGKSGGKRPRGPSSPGSDAERKRETRANCVRPRRDGPRLLPDVVRVEPSAGTSLSLRWAAGSAAPAPVLISTLGRERPPSVTPWPVPCGNRGVAHAPAAKPASVSESLARHVSTMAVIRFRGHIPQGGYARGCAHHRAHHSRHMSRFPERFGDGENQRRWAPRHELVK